MALIRLTRAWTRSTARRGLLMGLCLAVVAVVGLHWPLSSEATTGLALFLALTACVYPGALLAQIAGANVAAAEIAVGAAVFACAWLGLAFGAAWLTLGYAVHGAWDWLHHVHVVPTRTAEWFPPACAAFDFAVAAYALVAI